MLQYAPKVAKRNYSRLLQHQAQRKFPLNNSNSVKAIAEHFGAADCFFNYQCVIIVSYFDMKF